MKTFYALHRGLYEGVPERIAQLKAACEHFSIAFVCLDELTVNFTSLPIPQKGDMLYTLADGVQYLESIMLNDDVTTFYIKQPTLQAVTGTNQLDVLLQKVGIPKPKTIYTITTNRKLLNEYTEYLGGFPVIIKQNGSSRGVGTFKIDSTETLYSIVDYLINTQHSFVMKEFIKSRFVSRCRVLGNEVIDSFHYPILDKDFRNASLPFSDMPSRISSNFSSEIKAACVKATHVCNFEFSGVDFLVDTKGDFFILEVNNPSGMLLNWADNNFLAISMIEFLIKKSNCLFRSI